MIVSNEKNSKKNSFKWYAVEVTGGFGRKAKAELEDLIQKRQMQEYFQEIVSPIEEVGKHSGGKYVVSKREIYPGYIFVQMIANPVSWNFITNISKSDNYHLKPINRSPEPIPDAEVEKMFSEIQKRQEKRQSATDFQVGDRVKICSGNFSSFYGIITEMDPDKDRVVVNVSIFSRDTMVELPLTDVVKEV